MTLVYSVVAIRFFWDSCSSLLMRNQSFVAFHRTYVYMKRNQVVNSIKGLACRVLVMKMCLIQHDISTVN